MSDNLETPGASGQAGSKQDPSRPLSSSISIVPSAPPRLVQPASLATFMVHEGGIHRLLENLFEASGLTQEALGKRIGCGKPNVNQILNSNRPGMTLQLFLRVAEACGAKVWIDFPKERR